MEGPADLRRAPGEGRLGSADDTARESSRAASAGTPPAGETASTELSFGMVLRRGERERGGHTDITRYGAWRSYRQAQ